MYINKIMLNVWFILLRFVYDVRPVAINTQGIYV